MCMKTKLINQIMNCARKLNFGLLMVSILSLFHLNSLFATTTYFGRRPEVLMSDIFINSTYKIQGTDHEGRTITGTVFIIGHDFPEIPHLPGQSTIVFFTAAHVLEGIKGDCATVFLREKTGKVYKKIPYDLQIRYKDKPLWIKHPEVDIAAIFPQKPLGIDLNVPSTVNIATDEIFETKQLITGDKLFVLGYPFGIEANNAGFPILRTGTIASHPLSPIKDYKTFLMNFDVFGGNSGGPVFMQNRDSYGDITGDHNYIVGIVIENWFITKQVKDLEKIHPMDQKELGLAVVVHAQYMKELLQNIKVVPGQGHVLNGE